MFYYIPTKIVIALITIAPYAAGIAQLLVISSENEEEKDLLIKIVSTTTQTVEVTRSLPISRRVDTVDIVRWADSF
jgi:hypothetical protein